jgi:hypothetical protein
MRNALVLALLAAPAAALAAPCSSWEGQLTGNGVGNVHLIMCREGDHVTGTFSYRSDEGWDRRALEGEWRNGRLHLHDTTWLDYHVDPSTFYCMAERYDLAPLGGEQLIGTFDSADCQDHGPLALTLRDAWGGDDPEPLASGGWPLNALAGVGAALALLALLLSRRARHAVTPPFPLP